MRRRDPVFDRSRHLPGRPRPNFPLHTRAISGKIPFASEAKMTSSWTLEHLRGLDGECRSSTRVYTRDECLRMFPALYIWDPWPVLLPDGGPAVVDGAEIWMGLSAPSSLEPRRRHDVARLRLMSLERHRWRDHGNVFERGALPGSREWAGCATYDPDTARIEVWYTATGRHGEEELSFIQRIFRASATLAGGKEGFELRDWTDHRELARQGGYYRSTLEQMAGEPGFIKGFRDPSRFVDPADGRLYGLFTASLAGSRTDFDGAVGAFAGESAGELELLPPLLLADGVNNELERPHIVHRDGLYYLFYSTQARTFHPRASGPTGMYGFVADRLDGDWTPLNGSGLVLRNPPDEPFQAYSWLVMNDLSVVGFIDFPNMAGLLPEEAEARGDARRYFAGTISPREKIVLAGDRARLVQ